MSRSVLLGFHSCPQPALSLRGVFGCSPAHNHLCDKHGLVAGIHDEGEPAQRYRPRTHKRRVMAHLRSLPPISRKQQGGGGAAGAAPARMKESRTERQRRAMNGRLTPKYQQQDHKPAPTLGAHAASHHLCATRVHHRHTRSCGSCTRIARLCTNAATSELPLLCLLLLVTIMTITIIIISLST
jgi:hypothetical protein